MTLFNEYIIAKFTGEVEGFNKLILQKVSSSDKEGLKAAIDEANKIIEPVEGKIADKKDRTFRKQIFKVFYSGYVDYIEGKIKKFSQKKKFIELYLYSKGILLAKYKDALFKDVYNTDVIEPSQFKIHLMNELGITQFLKDKYKSLGDKHVEDKVVELFCTITGENPNLIKSIINYSD